MKDIIKLILKHLLLYALGGSIYYGIEVLYRGFSHPSMIIVGGLCFVIIGMYNEIYNWDVYIEKQVFFGVITVLLLEFLSGCIINLLLGLNVWDYSNMPFNLLGQICLPFAILWIPLVLFAIFVDDYIRYRVFNEEKPRYKSWIIEKIKSIF